MPNKQTILDNTPLGWIIAMLASAGITVGWYFAMVHYWPNHPVIGWILFAIPASNTILIPLMYVIRRIQRKRGKL